MQNYIAQRSGLFVWTILALLSCQKDRLDTSAAPSSMLQRHGSSCASGVRLACGGRILEFTDTAHYQAVYDCLEVEYQAHQDWALGQYGLLDDEAYNDILDSIGFNDDEPLEEFEQCLGFSS